MGQLLEAFVIGAGSITSLADGLLYSLAFGLGFGWPLVLLPVLDAPAQRRFTQSLGRHYRLLMRASSLLLVGIGLFGAWTEVTPSFGLLAGR
jgi:cytochrome c biogenesis protein CcdA